MIGDSWAGKLVFSIRILERLKGFREDRRGGGEKGGLGELKDLDVSLVKLSTDFEVDRLGLLSRAMGLPQALPDREATGLPRAVVGVSNDCDSGEATRYIFSARIPFSSR